MEDFHFIDKLVKDKLENHKVNYNTSWQDIQKNLDAGFSGANSGTFFKTTFFKVATGLVAFFTAGLFLFFFDETEKGEILYPSKSTYELKTIRQAPVIQKIEQQDKEQQINSTHRQINEKPQAVVIIEQTKVDTL